MCSIDSLYGPHNCELVEDWISVSFLEKTQIKQKMEDHIYRDSEVVQSEKHKKAKVLVRLSKGNTKSKK
jgi:hypothetical protein